MRHSAFCVASIRKFFVCFSGTERDWKRSHVNGVTAAEQARSFSGCPVCALANIAATYWGLVSSRAAVFVKQAHDAITSRTPHSC